MNKTTGCSSDLFQTLIRRWQIDTGMDGPDRLFHQHGGGSCQANSVHTGKCEFPRKGCRISGNIKKGLGFILPLIHYGLISKDCKHHLFKFVIAMVRCIGNINQGSNLILPQ